MFDMLTKMLSRLSGGGRIVCETAMLLLSATTVFGIGALLFTGPVSAEVCSKRDAAETVLGWLENDGKVISVIYEEDSGGYLVRVRYYTGDIRDFFVERGDRC